MPSKRRARKRRRSSASLPFFLLLLVAAAAVWWTLLRPLPPHRAPRTQHAPVPSVRQPVSASRVPSQTPSLMPSLTPSRTPSSAPALAASPMPTQAARLPRERGRLAIIIDDCGQWLPVERAFLHLPVTVTLAVLPFVHGTADIQRDAQRTDRPVILHLPMQPFAHLYPGPGEITLAMSDAQIERQVERDLAQVPLARGVNNHEGSAATSSARVMRAVARVLRERGLFFVDSRTAASSVAARITTAMGVPTVSRDVFLDDRNDLSYVEGQLREAAAIALRSGSAVAIGHPRAATLDALRAMIPALQREGITFVSVQSLAENEPLSGPTSAPPTERSHPTVPAGPARAP